MGFAIGFGPDLPTQAILTIRPCFTSWIRPPNWGRNTTNDDDGNDDDTHTHTPSRQRRAREGAQAAAHHAAWERCSRLRAGQSLKGGPQSPDTKKQKKTVVSPFHGTEFSNRLAWPPGGPLHSTPAGENKQKKQRISVTCPFVLQADPSRTPNPPSGSRDHSVNLANQKISGVYANHARDDIAPWMGLGKGCDWPYDLPVQTRNTKTNT